MSRVACLAEVDRPARMQIQQLLDAIVAFCSGYRNTEQAVLNTMRCPDGFLPPRRLVSRPMVPTGLPTRFKRKYEHIDGMMDHTMQPERKLAYRPSHAVTKSWVPHHAMKMEPAPMAPVSPTMCSDIGLLRHPNMLKVGVDGCVRACVRACL